MSRNKLTVVVTRVGDTSDASNLIGIIVGHSSMHIGSRWDDHSAGSSTSTDNTSAGTVNASSTDNSSGTVNASNTITISSVIYSSTTNYASGTLNSNWDINVDRDIDDALIRHSNFDWNRYSNFDRYSNF